MRVQFNLLHCRWPFIFKIFIKRNWMLSELGFGCFVVVIDLVLIRELLEFDLCWTWWVRLASVFKVFWLEEFCRIVLRYSMIFSSIRRIIQISIVCTLTTLTSSESTYRTCLDLSLRWFKDFIVLIIRWIRWSIRNLIWFQFDFYRKTISRQTGFLIFICHFNILLI